MEFMAEDLAVSMLPAADIFRQIHYTCTFSVEENVAVSTDIFRLDSLHVRVFGGGSCCIDRHLWTDSLHVRACGGERC